ncbi:MAG TPA: lysylphosphatidylglycerol synthase transmembrane domain-containing protein [Cyclobacteriaceae bacterium]|nr:lysylphosphatidylglycerol synthase transmembrane domain-containing protein [Cyclobacteriaceae bacterium]
MPPRLKALFQYVIIFLVTAFLIWYALSRISVGEGENRWEYILDTWRQADKVWLGVMAAFAIGSHILRAMRWKMLLVPTGHRIALMSGFLSLMVGYLVNLVIPRGGEVTRCYNLYKLERTPVDVTFGTVVMERIVDLLCLCLLILLAFALEWNKLLTFVRTLELAVPGVGLPVVVVLALVLVFGGGWYLARRSRRFREFFRKTWTGIKRGFLSILKLEYKGAFVLYSVLIWVMYFFMSYAVIRAFEPTAHLGFSAVISLFAIGSIAMAAPLPGGTGAYHVLVPQGLSLLYGLVLKDAVALTFVFHGWQTLIMIVGGAASLLITAWKVRRGVRGGETGHDHESASASRS